MDLRYSTSTIAKEKLIESVYVLIKHDYGGRAATKDFEKEMNDTSKPKMRYAIRHLTHEDKIKQVGDFEAKEIQYYYEIL